MSLEQFKGIVANVKVNKGFSKTSGKPYKIVIYTVGNDMFSRFESVDEQDNDFNEGDEINGTYEQDDKYKNIKTMNLISSGNKVTVTEHKPEVLDMRSKSLAVQMIQSTEETVFQEKLNAFGEDHNVLFTQTHVTPIGDNRQNGTDYKIIYTAFVFWKK